MLLLMALLGDPTIMDVSGSIGGKSFTPMSAYYGGYIAFFNVEIDCKEMY